MIHVALYSHAKKRRFSDGKGAEIGERVGEKSSHCSILKSKIMPHCMA